MRREIEFVVKDIAGIDAMLKWAAMMARKGLAAGPVVCRLGRERRSLDQNACLWPTLTDISQQVEWHGQKLTKEEWKDLFTGSMKNQIAVPAIGGPGIVMVGGRTSKMNKQQFSELLEFIFATGAELGVEWSRKSRDTFVEHNIGERL